MPASKSEIRQLLSRTKKLRDHVVSVSKSLEKARGGELHVAVTTSGRIATVLSSTFDVGSAEAAVLYDINPRLISLSRSDRDKLVDIKARLLQAFNDMVKHFDTRMSSLARTECSA